MKASDEKGAAAPEAPGTAAKAGTNESLKEVTSEGQGNAEATEATEATKPTEELPGGPDFCCLQARGLGVSQSWAALQGKEQSMRQVLLGAPAPGWRSSQSSKHLPFLQGFPLSIWLRSEGASG